MRAPYFRLTSRCNNDLCPVDTFVTERKRIHYTSTSGRLETCIRQVCPECKTWGFIIETEEIK